MRRNDPAEGAGMMQKQAEDGCKSGSDDPKDPEETQKKFGEAPQSPPAPPGRR